jgi:hypothetical protein
MTRQLLIALICIGAFCFTTDTNASSDVLEIQAVYTWAGLAPTWPHQTFSIICSSDPECTVKAVLREGQPPLTDPKRRECSIQTTVPKKRVQALLDDAQADLKAVPKPVEVIGHTDDYPHWDVRIRLDSGGIRLLNTSNTGPKGTWNVQQSGRWSVQQSDRFGRAFKAMLEPIYKSGNRNCPTR